MYFLHQQVGLAFLMGLGFAIILIPINKVIARKMAKIYKAMMKEKDGRVKVSGHMSK